MIQENVFYHHSSCHGNYNYTSNAGLFWFGEGTRSKLLLSFCSTLCFTPQGHKNSASVPYNTPANCNTMQFRTFFGIWYLPNTWILRASVLLPTPSFPCRSSTPASSCCFADYDLDTAAAASADLQFLGLASARYSDLGLEKVVRYAMAWYGVVWYGSIRCMLVGVSTISAEGFAKLAFDPWLLLFLVLVQILTLLLHVA